MEQYPAMVQFMGYGVTVQTESPANFVAAGAASLLLETGDYILLETGDKLLLEA